MSIIYSGRQSKVRGAETITFFRRTLADNREEYLLAVKVKDEYAFVPVRKINTSALENINDIAGINFNARTINAIILDMESADEDDSSEVIPYFGNGMGFNFKNGEVLSYRGSKIINSKGEVCECIALSPLLTSAGTAEEWANGMRRYLEGKTMLPLILLHSISSLIKGLLNIESSTLIIVGRTSTGKTLASKLCTSAYGTETSAAGIRINKSLSDTEKSIYSDLCGNKGVCLTLDDASMDIHQINFQNLLYVSSTNTEIGTANRKRGEETKSWATNIIISSEHNIIQSGRKSIDTTRKGVLARSIEVTIGNDFNDSLFKNAEEAETVSDFISQQNGTAAPLVVEYLLKHYTIESLNNLRKNESAKLRVKYAKNCEDNLFCRQLNNLALYKITGNILNELFGLNIDVEHIIDKAVEVLINNKLYFTNRVSNSEKVYRDIVKATTLSNGSGILHDDEADKDYVWVTVKKLKEQCEIYNIDYNNFRNELQEKELIIPIKDKEGNEVFSIKKTTDKITAASIKLVIDRERDDDEE